MIAAPKTFTSESHPEKAADERDELVNLAANIGAWQERTSPRLSDESMVRRFPGLGSTKTYRKLRRGDLESLRIETHLPKYRGVWHQLQEAIAAGEREAIYPDLTPALEVGFAVAGLIPQRGNERLVLVEGATGSGKTRSLDCVAERYAGQVARMEATEAWASPTVMLGDMLVALGVYRDTEEDLKRMPASKGARLHQVTTELRGGRRVLLIDEGHHLTAPGLNLLKSILNKTDSVIVLACIDTLWGKLAAKSWQEAKQLVFNRLFERVRLQAPSREDVLVFLRRRCPVLDGAEGKDWTRAADRIAGHAGRSGNFAFLRRLAARVNEGDIDADPAAVLLEAEKLTEALHTR